MVLIIFHVTGAILGWLAAIVQRIEDAQRVLANVAVGSIGAVVGGILANRESILYGISAVSIPVAIVGALVMLGILSLFRNRLSDGRF